MAHLHLIEWLCSIALLVYPSVWGKEINSTRLMQEFEGTANGWSIFVIKIPLHFGILPTVPFVIPVRLPHLILTCIELESCPCLSYLLHFYWVIAIYGENEALKPVDGVGHPDFRQNIAMSIFSRHHFVGKLGVVVWTCLKREYRKSLWVLIIVFSILMAMYDVQTHAK
jgi:hypothetical protein